MYAGKKLIASCSFGKDSLAAIIVSEERGIHISTNSVSFKLNGKREFAISEIERIAGLFGCSLDYLVGHEVRPASNSKNEPITKPPADRPA